MSTISAHGGLVHVVLCVRSVTSEGVTVLVRNSPNLLTFCARVCNAAFDIVSKKYLRLDKDKKNLTDICL